MEVLLSWSKRRSREAASALHSWIPKVLPGVRPWMSAKDIAKGKDWFSELQGLLGEARICIICVTKENVRSPWLYYETGAIAAKGEHVLVFPYLIGIGSEMLSDGPFGKWQCTSADKEDTLALIQSLNEALGEPVKHYPSLIAGNFEIQWPSFEMELRRISALDLDDGEFTVLTSADEVAGGQLSSEARILLLKAAGEQNGLVLSLRNSGGGVVQVSGHNFVEQGNARSEAAWKGAVEELIFLRLLEARGHKNNTFAITARGYEVADALNEH